MAQLQLNEITQTVGELYLNNRALTRENAALQAELDTLRPAEPQSLADQTEDGEVVLPTEEWEETR